MNHDVHILLACLVGVTFAALLLTAAGRGSQSQSATIHKFPANRSESAKSNRRAA